ncbi:gamma-glutamylcyclotransferase family protein [Alteribacillus bidgolensis]|uniref:Uncharacterized conserved protein YtfP, gamma-glutamylcyclotransferase (GGCT)/AIG2-like family n=1 Tax=Alteribacillus bidgolensis TaxID=930129 RepID=A0A1G8HHF5_9BACI|nr:gamma-glutamylcyclotransferase family protein [Alteribacillus bidgolensis]SDI06093.1 Uncharacterized conserved protein YtfP, gamma-glutamylcyclotransferase (GGCT)/AIG2-like family [Alteribacillus bidgolensis]
MKNLPVFVYGTLRHGLRNYQSYLNGRTEKEVPATTKGRMVCVENGSFPCLFPEGNNIIQGELMYISDEIFPEVLKDLDWVEGYDEADLENSMYERKVVTVENKNGEKVEAFIYYWNVNGGIGEYIPSGCWVTHVSREKEKTN